MPWVVVDLVRAELDRVGERISGRFTGGEPRLCPGRRKDVFFWTKRIFGAGSCLLAGVLAGACGGCAAVSRSQQVSYQGYGGTAIVSADGRTITVGPYPEVGCPATVTPVARESATQVALFLEYVTPPGPPSCLNVGVAEPMVGACDIRLAQPLGARKLADGATGRAIAWISARLVLRPAALPAGYRFNDLIPAADLSRRLGPAGAVQFYDSPDTPAAVEITQSAGVSPRMPGPGAGGWTAIRVRGHRGRAACNLITWRENGLTDFIVVRTQNGPDEPQVLSTQQLIAIADSAPAYDPGPLPTSSLCTQTR